MGQAIAVRRDFTSEEVRQLAKRAKDSSQARRLFAIAAVVGGGERREFITLLGGAAAWPLAARAQQPAKRPIVGFLGDSTPLAESERAAAFARRLHDLGWIEGRTIAIEYRWADGRSDRLAEIAAEFARLKVDIIVTGGTPAVMAAKQAAPVIPISFAAVGDPVGTGIVASLARPGGNGTGLSALTADLAGKRLGLFHDVR